MRVIYCNCIIIPIDINQIIYILYFQIQQCHKTNKNIAQGNKIAP